MQWPAIYRMHNNIKSSGVECIGTCICSPYSIHVHFLHTNIAKSWDWLRCAGRVKYRWYSNSIRMVGVIILNTHRSNKFILSTLSLKLVIISVIMIVALSCLKFYILGEPLQCLHIICEDWCPKITKLDSWKKNHKVSTAHWQEYAKLRFKCSCHDRKSL